MLSLRQSPVHYPATVPSSPLSLSDSISFVDQFPYLLVPQLPLSEHKLPELSSSLRCLLLCVQSLDRVWPNSKGIHTQTKKEARSPVEETDKCYNKCQDPSVQGLGPHRAFVASLVLAFLPADLHRSKQKTYHLKTEIAGDFPHGPADKTPCSQCRRPGFSQGMKVPHSTVKPTRCNQDSVQRK